MPLKQKKNNYKVPKVKMFYSVTKRIGNQCNVEYIIIILTRLLATLFSCQGPAIPFYLMYAGILSHINFCNFCNQCDYSEQIWQKHPLVMGIYMWWNIGLHPSSMIDTLEVLKICWNLNIFPISILPEMLVRVWNHPQVLSIKVLLAQHFKSMIQVL